MCEEFESRSGVWGINCKGGGTRVLKWGRLEKWTGLVKILYNKTRIV